MKYDRFLLAGPGTNPKTTLSRFKKRLLHLGMVNQTKCRFDCWNVKESRDYKGEKTEEEITLSAATSLPGEESDTEINQFSKYTPVGRMEMTVTNPEIWGFFKAGHSYYLNIEEVPMEKQPQYIQDFIAGKEEGA